MKIRKRESGRFLHEARIRLIQDIAEMLKEPSDNELLRCIEKATKAANPQFSGPLEAYEAAKQLQDFVIKETT